MNSDLKNSFSKSRNILEALGSENSVGRRRSGRSQKGFTLIELLTVMTLVSVLSGMMVHTFKQVKNIAAYAVVNQTMHDSQTALSAALVEDIDHQTSLVLTSQNIPGPLTDALANSLFPGFILPRDSKISVSYNPDCLFAGCTAQFIEIRHCRGIKYKNWLRLGDGTEITLEGATPVGVC